MSPRYMGRLRYICLYVGMIMWSDHLLAQSSYAEKIQTTRAERAAMFRNPHTSPLRDSAHTFQGFDYYPVDSLYRVEAVLTRTDSASPFEIPTSDPNVTKTYVTYGVLSFALQGRTHHLSIYQRLSPPVPPMFRNHLLLPFRDATTGQHTYGGGRYIDLRVPESDTVILDFNTSYNPNCAYSDGWSCPLPPPENTLNIAIKAGEKNYPEELYVNSIQSSDSSRNTQTNQIPKN